MKAKVKSAKKISKEVEKAVDAVELSKIDRDLDIRSNNLYEHFNFSLVGRPTKYNAEMPKKVNEFIAIRASKDYVPTIEGLSLYLRISKDTVYAWGEKHKKFSYALQNLMRVQGEMLVANGLSGQYNSTITQLLLKNNHGFHDKHEIDHTSDGERIGKIEYIVPEDNSQNT